MQNDSVHVLLYRFMFFRNNNNNLRLCRVLFAILVLHANGLVGVVAVTEKEHEARGGDDFLVDNTRQDGRRGTDTQNGSGKAEQGGQVVKEQRKERNEISRKKGDTVEFFRHGGVSSSLFVCF